MLLEGVGEDPSAILKSFYDPLWRKRMVPFYPGPITDRSLGHWHGAGSGRTQSIVKIRGIRATARLTLQIPEGLATRLDGRAIRIQSR